ncbi:hypothetical protein TNCV_3147981 [Trichonephila clavipes]|nr:hypothetical protein TNCV_3147981 [Trichonephila clavipes]
MKVTTNRTRNGAKNIAPNFILHIPSPINALVSEIAPFLPSLFPTPAGKTDVRHIPQLSPIRYSEADCGIAGSGFESRAVNPKCLGVCGPPFDRDRRNAYPGSMCLLLLVLHI